MKEETRLRKIVNVLIVLVILAAILLAIVGVVRYRNRVPAAVVSDTPFTEALSGHEKLSLTAEAGSAHPGGVTLTRRNDTGADLHVDHGYAIDVHLLRDGQWYPVLRRTDKKAVTQIPAIDIVIPAEKTSVTVACGWEPFLGLLEPGHYRLIWRCRFTDETGSNISVPLIAEFDIE